MTSLERQYACVHFSGCGCKDCVGVRDQYIEALRAENERLRSTLKIAEIALSEAKNDYHADPRKALEAVRAVLGEKADG